MSPSGSPFLRSPPFPWVAADVAAVSHHGSGRISDPPGLMAALRDARVGGAFWAAADPWDRPDPTIRAEPGDEDAIVGWLRGGEIIGTDGTAIADGVLQESAFDRLSAAVYRDPFADRPADAFRAIEILRGWRRSIKRNVPIATAAGMAGWKRDAIAQFLWDGQRSPRFVRPGAAQEAGSVIAYWPSRVPADFAAALARDGATGWPVEDGFLRSNGLGAECREPMSILIDRTGGLYFDPERSSEIETILATHDFDAPLLQRAKALREAIVAARLGKYGVDRMTDPLPDLPRDRRVILAVGQVGDDLSVVLGGAGIAGNAPFLARVRAEEPDAYILYRPHPDVVAGLRRGRVADPVAAGLVDRVVTGGSLLSLIAQVAGVHVLSSLTGFEALLRNCPVTVHGRPFYAGWGLTRDLVAQPARRTRTLSLDGLVAGALIVAPRYRDPVTLLPCEPEVLVRRLAAAQTPRATMVTAFRKAFGVTRRTLAAAGERL